MIEAPISAAPGRNLIGALEVAYDFLLIGIVNEEHGQGIDFALEAERGHKSMTQRKC